MEKLSIYGAGYVGLVTGTCFAELGHDVLIMDVNAEKVAALQQGRAPIYEMGLDDLLQANIKANRLKFTTDLSQTVEHGLFQFIAVGTPSAEDGSADLRYVLAVAEGIGKYLNDYKIIINKSTVALGTAQKVSAIIQQKLKDRALNIEFDVVSNPEFLKQGAAIEDFMNPDRIIVGIDSQRALAKLQSLYAKLTNKLMVMDVASAELTKYAANAYLASRISFMNEMSQLAERYGADIENVRRGMGSDRRIGPHFLNAGCGFGGSCFPKDVRALNIMASSEGYESPILTAIEKVNQQQKLILFEKIRHYFADDLHNKTIALWGLAFKPKTDDIREATSLVLIDALLAAGVRVQAYDPCASVLAKKNYEGKTGIIFCNQRDETLTGSDVLVIVTEWDEFRNPDFALIKQQLRYPAIFDGRNIYNPEILREYGFHYYGVGRKLPSTNIPFSHTWEKVAVRPDEGV